jgi:hypothetical protein
MSKNTKSNLVKFASAFSQISWKSRLYLLLLLVVILPLICVLALLYAIANPVFGIGLAITLFALFAARKKIFAAIGIVVDNSKDILAFAYLIFLFALAVWFVILLFFGSPGDLGPERGDWPDRF